MMIICLIICCRWGRMWKVWWIRFPLSIWRWPFSTEWRILPHSCRRSLDLQRKISCFRWMRTWAGGLEWAHWFRLVHIRSSFRICELLNLIGWKLRSRCPIGFCWWSQWLLGGCLREHRRGLGRKLLICRRSSQGLRCRWLLGLRSFLGGIWGVCSWFHRE